MIGCLAFRGSVASSQKILKFRVSELPCHFLHFEMNFCFWVCGFQEGILTLQTCQVSGIWREVHTFWLIHAKFLKINDFHSFSGSSSHIHSKFCTISGPAEGEGQGRGLQPPHFFGNFKELLRKKVFSALPLWVTSQPLHFQSSSAGPEFPQLLTFGFVFSFQVMFCSTSLTESSTDSWTMSLQNRSKYKT